MTERYCVITSTPMGRVKPITLHLSNGCTWAHIVDESSTLFSMKREELLGPEELDALDGKACAEGIVI